MGINDKSALELRLYHRGEIPSFRRGLEEAAHLKRVYDSDSTIKLKSVPFLLREYAEASVCMLSYIVENMK